jgi:hypothetical protein
MLVFFAVESIQQTTKGTASVFMSRFQIEPEGSPSDGNFLVAADSE